MFEQVIIMRKIYLFVVLATILALAVGYFDGEPKEIRCKGKVLNNTGTFYTNMKMCKDEFVEAKKKNEEHRKTGMNCLTFCALTKDGIFDDKGAYNEARLNSSSDISLPTTLADTHKNETALCVKNLTLPVYDPKDSRCTHYESILSCFTKAWMETCMDGYDDVMS